MAEGRNYTKPTEDRIIVDRAELNKTVNDTLTSLGGLEDGTLAKVDAVANSVVIRDAYGRAKVTHASNGKTDGDNDFIVNIGLLNEKLQNLKNSLSQTYYTKEETTEEIQKIIDDLLTQLGNLDVNIILQATKRIDDHIAVTDKPHGATSALFPGAIPFRDSYGQFEVGKPQKDSHVARLDTVKEYFDGIDLEFLRNIKDELDKIEDILINTIILWETVEAELI